MKHFISTFMMVVLASFSAPALAMPAIGKPAPAFSANDTNGQPVSLEALKGKTVVLEWTNHKCPFVVKHYKSDNMQTLQKAAAEDKVVWVSLISSAPDKQGHVSADEANALASEKGASPAHIILDEDGMIGRAYGARTTPHMFIIDPAGNVAYMGAIDDKSSADPEDIKTSKNYVTAALSNLKAGQAVDPNKTQPYGCSVKY